MPSRPGRVIIVDQTGRDPVDGLKSRQRRGWHRASLHGCAACEAKCPAWEDSHRVPRVRIQGGKNMASQKIRIKLKAYEHNLIDQSAGRIVEPPSAQAPGSRDRSRCPLKRRSLRSSARPTSTRTAVNSSSAARTSVSSTSTTPAPRPWTP